MRTIILLILAAFLAQSSDVITRDNLYRLETVTRVEFPEEALPDSLAWSPDSERLVLASVAGVQVFDWKNSLEAPLLTLGEGQPFRCVDWAGSLIAAGCLTEQTTIFLWDSETGEQVSTLVGGDDSRGYGVNVISFSPDGTRLAANNINDNRVRVWSVPDGVLLAELNQASETPRDVAFSPDSQALLVNYAGPHLTLWDMQSYQPRWDITRFNSPYSIAFSPDGEHIALTNEDRNDWETLFIVDALTGDPLDEIHLYGNVFLPMYSPDGNLLMVRNFDSPGNLFFLDAHRGDMVLEYYDVGEKFPLQQEGFSPDGRWLATLTNDFGLMISGVGVNGDVPTPIPPLVINSYAHVTTLDGETLNVRKGPSTNDEILYEFRPRTYVHVIDGPVEADGFTWWKIETQGGEQGWAVERVGDVQTLTTAGGSTTPPETVITPKSQLGLGVFAIVTTLDGETLNVRRDPGTTYAVLHEFEQGELVQIVDGPVAADGFIWWKVTTSDGRQGWAVEYAGEVQTLSLDFDIPDAGENSFPIEVDGFAYVSTPPGEKLEVRTGAGISYPIAYELNRGAYLHVLEGPVTVDGFIWWKIEAQGNRQGWVIESKDGVQIITGGLP